VGEARILSARHRHLTINVSPLALHDKPRPKINTTKKEETTEKGEGRRKKRVWERGEKNGKGKKTKKKRKNERRNKPKEEKR
jgi:hypothetical protein